jgi:hypothetical protein
VWFSSLRLARSRAARKSENRFFEMSLVSLMVSNPFQMKPAKGIEWIGLHPPRALIELDE